MELKPVPNSINRNTGPDNGDVQLIIEDFLKNTYDFVLFKYPQIKNIPGQILYFDVANLEYNSVERVTYLKCRHSIVAAVLETRTEDNYMHWDFFRNLDTLKNCGLEGKFKIF